MNCHFLWNNVPIAEEDLIPLIKAKAGCGHFMINLKDKLDEARKVLSSNPKLQIEKERSKTPIPSLPPEVEKIVVVEETTDSASESSHEIGVQAVITTAKFTSFINKNQHTKRLLHSDHTEPSVRKGIISCACDFLAQECGEYASVSDRNEMVKIVVNVFSGLDQQEQFVTKWLHMKIKNNRRKNRLAEEMAESTTSKKRKTDQEVAEEDHQQMEYLKECKKVVDIARVKTALKTTLKLRLEQYTKEDTFSVFDNYTFFTKCPDLVGFGSETFGDFVMLIISDNVRV